MNRRGFLKFLGVAPAAPYVPAVEARPLLNAAEIRQSVDYYASNWGHTSREDLTDVILGIYPEQTPFVSRCK